MSFSGLSGNTIHFVNGRESLRDWKQNRLPLSLSFNYLPASITFFEGDSIQFMVIDYQK